MPERHNAVKLLLFVDVGGSMEDHVRVCEELFSAARAEFKHLVHFYFHNCVYDAVWRDSRRRHVEQVPVVESIRTYDRAIGRLVGDASMSPYEIEKEGGSVEAGTTSRARPGCAASSTPIRRGLAQPGAEKYWAGTASIAMIPRMTEDRMFPLTLDGLDPARSAA